MILFGRNLETEVALVAEIGVNHEGDAAAAQRIAWQAAEAGADAIKFQSYTPERFASASDPERLARVRRFQLDETAHRKIFLEAARRNVVVFSSAITEDWVPFLAAHCPAIKIASGDLTFEPVVLAAAQSGKPVLLSTGCGSVAEIDQAVEWIKQGVGASSLSERLVLLHCVSAYPTPIEQANVRAVAFLRDRYRVPVGYSNHVVEPEAVYAAVALGASVIEVHVTDKREGRAFRDHALSFEPDELAELVRRIRAIKTSLGGFKKDVQPVEAPLRNAIRKGVVAARDLPAGSILTARDMMFARPATEFPAHEMPGLVGRRLTDTVRHGELIKRSSVAPAK